MIHAACMMSLLLQLLQFCTKSMGDRMLLLLLLLLLLLRKKSLLMLLPCQQMCRCISSCLHA
jgi:hypothetical protein